MNGRGVGGSWGLGIATKPRDSISGRSCFWNHGTKGMRLGQRRQAGAPGRRGVFHVKGASVFMEGQEMGGLEFLEVTSWWLKGKHRWVSSTSGKQGFSEELVASLA